jgi:acetolactate synthase-1/2/3 large subunit
MQGITMKASDLFLRCLEAKGVNTIYGVPGEENADLMISLLDSSIEFISCRHEQSAAFMAQMEGELTGKPGVCLATLGPGATNLVTGVASANMDHAPLIAIIGQADSNRLHKESHQNMDAVSLFQPVTKWATTIRDPGVIPEVIEKAFSLSTQGKSGAVLIELPEDIAAQTTKTPMLPPVENCSRCSITSPKNIDLALGLIEKSKAPLLLLGAGCVRADADSLIREFVDKSQIYGAHTFMGKGSLGADHRFSLRCVGLGMKDIVLEAFDKADLIIAVGYDLVEYPPERWNKNHKSKVIHIDVEPAEIDQCYMPAVQLVGGIKGILKQLNPKLEQHHQKDEKIFSKIQKRINEDIQSLDSDTSFPVKPQKMLHDLREQMIGQDILISDVGAHKMWVARQYPTYHSKTCFISNGFCSMAGSIPAAFSAKRLFPERKVVALCGDGGFIMGIQALVTAVEHNTPIVVIVWEDNHYGLIKWKQEMHFKKHSHVDLVNPDLASVAKSFGCHSVKLTSTESLNEALTSCFSVTDKPSVLVVPIDYSENMKLFKHLGDIVSH